MQHAPTLAHHWRDLEKTHDAQGIRIDSQTAATHWRGERMDYDLGVWVLCNQAERARGEVHWLFAVSAEMPTHQINQEH
jgi:hypothetical protein